MSIDLEKLEEPFDLNTAEKLLREGYYVRHINWKKGDFLYVEDSVIYNQDDEEVGFHLLFNEKFRTFEFFYEEEPCQNQVISGKMEESGIMEDGEQKKRSRILA